MWFLVDIAIVAVLAFLALCLFVWLAQTALIFPAGGEVRRTPQDKGWQFQELRIATPGGMTHGWFMPVEGAAATILFSHGNAGTIDERLDLCPTFRALGCNVLLYDYGGYGNSSGKASEKRCLSDIRAMWHWLTEERGIAPETILLYGRSLGCGPSIQLAREVRPGGLVLESGFTSVADMVDQLFPGVPVHFLIRHRFNNLGDLPHVKCPVLVMHSPDDEIIPYSHGRKLFEAANEPKHFVTIRGDHSSGHFASIGLISDGLEWLLQHHA